MKAAQLYQFNEQLNGSEFLVYEDVPEPVIETPADVIVRIGGAGVCGTDLELIKGAWCSLMRIDLPMIPGHENAGWVEEIGDSVTSVKVGDPVLVFPLGGLNAWEADSRGKSSAHPRNLYPGFNRNGGFAEYLLTEESMLVGLPTHLSPMDSAPLTDAGLTAYSAAKKASEHLSPGRYVLVIGVGGLGHVAIQVLKSISAAEIIAVDRSEKALELARQVGAHYAFVADKHFAGRIRSLSEGRGVDVTIDFVGKDGTTENGLSITRRGGYYYLVGCGGTLSIPTLHMVVSQKTIVGVLGGTKAELGELITMVDRGLVSLTIREYSLSEANLALRHLMEGRNPGRSVLIP